MRKIRKIHSFLQEVKNLSEHFYKKIKTNDELKKIIGSFPRKNTVVMCRGVFDIVHPGHLRQFTFAKSKGDILMVSITADKYIKKRSISPYVPQELRALNLAMLEIVDYVVIDNDPWAIGQILTLRPNYYVKGHEYALHGIHPKTKEEIDTLATYGGKMLFSPGDIVYSSSRYLSANKPNLSVDQLLNMMRMEKLNFRKLRNTIKGFRGIKVHVVGDLIVDKYTTCTILGPSQKSPAFSVRQESYENFVGGAGIVAKHLKSLGADVTFTTIFGKDEQGKLALKDLKKSGIKVNAIYEKDRPTTVKERYLESGNRLLLQVDHVSNNSISDYALKKVCKLLQNTQCQAIICSDFRHGIFNNNTIPEITNSIPNNVARVADSQVSNRWGNILDFSGFDLITPNEKEARFALGIQDSPVNEIAEDLYQRSKCKYLILKLGSNGVIVYIGKNDGLKRNYVYLDSFVDNLVDPIGAGDALLATSTLTLVSSQDIFQASILGNLAAAIECSKLGNVPVEIKDLLETTENLERRF